MVFANVIEARSLLILKVVEKKAVPDTSTDSSSAMHAVFSSCGMEDIVHVVETNYALELAIDAIKWRNQELPKNGWTAITVSSDTYERFQIYAKVHNRTLPNMFEQCLKDKEALQAFASKIDSKKIPKIVRVYTQW